MENAKYRSIHATIESEGREMIVKICQLCGCEYCVFLEDADSDCSIFGICKNCQTIQVDVDDNVQEDV